MSNLGIEGRTHGYRERWISEEELKAEAVKWIKNMDITKSAEYCDGMMDFIMDFFNLTEEDLAE